MLVVAHQRVRDVWRIPVIYSYNINIPYTITSPYVNLLFIFLFCYRCVHSLLVTLVVTILYMALVCYILPFAYN